MEFALIIGFIIVLLLLQHLGILLGSKEKRSSTAETRQELDTDLLYGADSEQESVESKENARDSEHD